MDLENCITYDRITSEGKLLGHCRQNLKIIEFEGDCRYSLSVSGQACIDLSKENNGMPVCFIINDVELDVNAKSTVEDIVDAYIHGSNRKHKKEALAEVPARFGRRPIMYTDFSKMDKNDPLLKELERRRPYSSSDFRKRHFIETIVHNPVEEALCRAKGEYFIKGY
jgi:hypothetical protein